MKLCINGRVQEAPVGATVLQATRLAGVEVPTLCHDNRLKPAGRLCLVQPKGFSHLVPACCTPAADGLEVLTHTSEIEETRRTLLHLLAEDYPPDAVERWPEKQFHRWLRHYGVSPRSNDRNPKESQSPNADSAGDGEPGGSAFGIRHSFGRRIAI